MAEVTKRDAQARIIYKLSVQVARMNEATTCADITVCKKELDAGWRRYQQLHDAVLDRAGSTELDEQAQIFEKVYDVYITASTQLCVRIAMPIEPTASSPKKDPGHRLKAITKMIVSIEHRTTEQISTMTAAVASHQLKALENLYDQYTQLFLNIISEENGENDNTTMSTVALLQSVLQSSGPPQSQLHESELKVPAIQIGTFDGTHANWECFRESFERVFNDRKSMPGVQKLQHLKGCLRGEAAELVSNFSLTNDNYESAWHLLNQRYNNPFELTRAHMRTLTSLPACKETASDILRLLNRTSSTLMALKNLKRPVDYWDDWIVHHVSEKLDHESRKMWEQKNAASNDFPTWCQLENFMENRVRALNAVNSVTTSSSTSSSSSQQKKVRAHVVSGQHSQQTSFSCPCCQQDHAIYMCHTFRCMSPSERRLLVAEKKLCFNCLYSKHLASHCSSSRLCRFCDQAHNSLLHLTNDSESAVTSNHSAMGPHTMSQVLLATAIVRIRAADGKMHEFRALLDQGSQASFITERAVQQLRLPKRRVECNIIGVGGTAAGSVTHAISAQVSSRFNDFGVSMDALILRKISQPIALPSNTRTSWPHLRGLNLADPNYMQPHRLDVLIGADLYGFLLGSELRKGSPSAPIAQKTSLGWIVSGPTRQSSTAPQLVATNVSAIDDQVNANLERFWTIEEVPTLRTKTIDEEACESHFKNSVSRDSSGRFHVRIPFRNKQPALGESIQMATRRQLQMERKFTTNDSFASEYRKFMAQYVELGHMKLIGAVTPSMAHKQPSYYIPHHAVLKESSSSTKLRVVFDASRRSTNGLSLNEQMLPGPRLQEDLSSIVMRWRKHRVVFTADVERMYRQIIIDEPDADLQRIVWRTSTADPLQIYQLSTVTYGTTSAPYLAVKSLQMLAELERSRFPVGATIAMQDFYVDDVLTGFDNIEQAMDGQRQLRQLMQSGGFELKKWTSNSSELLDHLPVGYCECRIPLELNLDQHVKTLGLQWNPVTDQFTFKVSFSTNATLATKRQFLSDAARLYDPLGWLAPSVILVKMMFQQLWQTKLSWDDRLPSPLAEQWPALRDSFCQLTQLRIDRWLGCSSTSIVELHGFCDSSIHAYAAAVYVRSTAADGAISVRLLCAKTKVAPLKTISLPRLELCGAVLLCRLMQNIQSCMQFGQTPTHLWTDSTIVLAWIKGSSSRWTVFVANRVAEIQRHYSITHWHHVPSEHNPADCATRGVHPDNLPYHQLWWTGPSWLRQSTAHWPSSSQIDDTTEELKGNSIAINNVQIASQDIVYLYSSFVRLIRITAQCMRFAYNCRHDRTSRKIGPLTVDELQAARLVWIKEAQREHFVLELKCLQRSQPLQRSSVLRSLNPVLQPDGLLHVGGRLINSLVMPEQAKTPIIIPRRCKLADLLVDHAHIHTLHGGPSLMLAHLRRNYWLIDGPNHVRSYVKKCNRCFRYSATIGQQMMAALPSARITPSRPFSHTAMDYSGAVMIRSARGRGQHATKGYISVFVCLATKAIHIEVVSDLTSAAFIAAYKRFTGRRGICSDLYSDNATNYVGAAAIFSNTERDLGFNNQVVSTLAAMGTTWHFSPPLSPHFNGLAESAIRSVKHHVRRIIGESTLTYEELSTFLIQVECCLNSRPLSPMSSDPTDFAALTPGHFLIGSALHAVPERNILSAKPAALTRWQLLQQMLQRFWVQWSAEYLHTLQQRKKWQQDRTNFAIGDLVLVTDDNHPPASWPLGRIIEVHTGKDGNVRVVTVRTANQTMKRGIVKLARLPSQDAD